ncbi:hypothetical protein ABH922_004199 [Rhodococcus sp. 27YEA15]|uniref:hypothetical protein n=1 Tax=Rhodococcus sp. 27YEA15 TaxID=3156259 RepID=UPI003C7C6C65
MLIGTSPHSKQTPETPAWVAPTNNVFGDWKVSFPVDLENPYNQQCRDWGNTVAATPVLNKYVGVDTPHETLPQYPTW